MKRVLLLMLLIVSSIAFGQTTIDLSGMTEDVTLGQNCSASQTPEEYVTTGDVNLNGFTLDLRNVNLSVTGNVNGSGEITGCGQTQLCVNGSVQNSPTIEDGLDCSTLSNPDFTVKDRFSFNNNTKTVTIENAKFIKVFNMSGQQVLYTKEATLNFDTLVPGIYIFTSDKFRKKLPVY